MPVEAVPVMAKITGRASNQLIVGAPLCQNNFSFEPSGEIYLIMDRAGRNPDYVDLNIQFTIPLLKTAGILRVLPLSDGKVASILGDEYSSLPPPAIGLSLPSPFLQ